ncbi:MAG: glycoside hydrolase family 13 protein [Ruminococcaceae bacterium]|nr:glycoside hydrolase family 13 protein [Oscillospiraceae bacterium]
MRILFDSRSAQHKTPFGTVRTGESCVLKIYVPDVCAAIGVNLVLENTDDQIIDELPLTASERDGKYQIWQCELSLESGLYFYWFRVQKKDDSFRLFKQGSGTNMEDGEKWQLSFIPSDFVTPEFAKGAVMYQIFPDRFHKVGECDLNDKLGPFHIHEDLTETPRYTADCDGNWCNDFYGGNLRGIQEKLPYLKELGVSILYLNPIFMAYSNHRYDTADYKRIDPMLGTEEDFAELCAAAHELDMKIILDGVFSHTGSKSIYFDVDGYFGGGAVSQEGSCYREWYRFHRYPDQFDSWWGMPNMPNVEELTPSYMDFIFADEDSVIEKWMKLGADGFRLDVVDELPDEFVKPLKERMRQINPDALLIGEVWEDASNKRSYGVSRRYFVDAELDSTMHYPWRKAILDFVMGYDDGKNLGESIMSIAENYPPQVLSCVMNILSTHDTPRVLTLLGDPFEGDREEKAERYLTKQARAVAIERLRLAAFLQFTLPGMASIYYGDEAGMQGYDDPFCRRYYPWGSEDTELRDYFAHLAKLKNNTFALREASVLVKKAGGGVLIFERPTEGETATIYVNRSKQEIKLPQGCELRFGSNVSFDGENYRLLPNGFCMVYTYHICL